MKRDDEKSPCGPKKADTEKRDQSRDDRISHSPERAEQYLDRYIEKIKGHQEVHHASADLDNSEIGAEQMLKGVGKIVKCSDDDSHYEEHHKSTFPDTLHHTVPAAGADILTDESGDGNAERSHDHILP